MSITLKDDRSFGGTAYPAGTTLSLDGALEANMVAQGLATWAGQAPYQGGATHPAQLAVDDHGNVTALVGPRGAAGFVDAGLFGASPSATATVNAAAIQEALDVGGLVTLRQAGTYLINNPLIISSNTCFMLGPDVEIKQANGINKNLIQNYAYANLATIGKSITSLTYTNPLVTAVCPNHGFSTGDWVSITGSQTYGSGSITAGYGGVYRIDKVDANTFTYYPGKTLAASATGTLIAVKADENITICGGKWNHNGANNSGSGSTHYACATEFFHVRGLFIDGMHFYNESGLKYAVHGGSINLLHINNVLLDTDSDGIHIKGPLINANIENVQGRVKDDGIILDTRDTWPSGLGGQYLDICGGNIENCRICNISLDSPYASVALFPFDVNYSMENILVDNVTGDTDATVKLWGEYTVYHQSGVTKNIVLSRLGIHPKKNTASSCLVNMIDFSSESLMIRDIALPSMDAAQLYNNGFISIAGVINLKKLALSNISGKGSSGVCRLVMVATGGTIDIKDITADNIHYEQDSGNYRLFRFDGGTIGRVALNNVRTKNGDNIVNVQAGVTIGSIEIANSYFDSPWIVVSSSVSTTIKVTDSHYQGANAFINATTASTTINIYAKGATFGGSGSKLINGGASTTINVYGWDANVDVGASGIAKVAGGYCFNIGSGRGTLTQNRLVACNGTNWFQLDNPALVY